MFADLQYGSSCGLLLQVLGPDFLLWKMWIKNKILAPVRKADAQSEHQNTTLDHSYYANRALLDGYMMSGVGHRDFQSK